MRLVVQPVAGGFELCARLGLVLVPPQLRGLTGFDGGKIVHAVLDRSPGARAGIEARDIIVSVDGQPWDSVRRLTFSDRRPSEITAQTFVARYFAFAKILVRMPPEPYRPLDDIAAEAARVIAAKPTPETAPYRRPLADFEIAEFRELMARLSPRRRRR
jgi:membrane-associated protease RseP (regulator of RpoE activity)